MLNKHIRSVTLELSQANMLDFDSEKFVRSLVTGNFNTIVCFAIGYLNGEAYFNSKFIKKNKDIINRDILRELSDLKKKYNFNFIAYINTQFSDVFLSNPSWAQKRVDNKKTTQLNTAAICLNSPYKNILLNSAKEISLSYKVDGFYFDEVSFQSWCNCAFCKKKYKIDSGRNIPNEINFHNKNFLNWMSWRQNQVNNFMKEFYNNLKKINKRHIIFFQSAFPISSTFTKMKDFQYINPVGNRVPKEYAGSYRPSFYGQNIEKNHKYNDIISIEPWRKLVGSPIWWPGVCTSYVKNLNPKKHVLPLMELPHFPWSLLNLSNDEIIFNIADVQANGGGTWYPMYSPNKKNLLYWSKFRKYFQQFNIIPKYREQIFDVAVLFSKNNAEKINTNETEDNYIDDFNNTISILKEIKINFTTLSFDSISKLKTKPKLILLINHEFFNKKEYDYFKLFLNNGGKIISWGRTPKFLESNNKVTKNNVFLKDIFGLQEKYSRPYFGYLNYSNSKENILSPTYGINNFFQTTIAKKIGYLFEGESMFATPDEAKQTGAVFEKKFKSGKAIMFSNNQSLIWSKAKSLATLSTIKKVVFDCINKNNVFYSNSKSQFSFYIWKKNKNYLIWLTNFSSIEENGNCNSISKIELIIPNKIKKMKLIKNFGNSHVSLKKNNIIVRNLKIWECLEVTII